MRSEQEVSDYERTFYEANLDLGYAIVVSDMHRSFFTRIKKSITLINIFSGTGAFAGALAMYPKISAACGFLVAMLSCVELVCDPGKSADAHARDLAEYVRLKSRVAGKNAQWIDAKKTKIDITSAQCLSGLSVPAFNANLRSNGRYDSVRKLSLWERLLQLMI
ncbi:hypothetical protein [Xanthomonas arboricola]|uniref:hypothetical protein n=1 Tax=Xanthomonas arboricola TaxID=56448 RepID=UPI00128FDA21|nr:hypothetical protein [Xanthomonas arboricola]